MHKRRINSNKVSVGASIVALAAFMTCFLNVVIITGSSATLECPSQNFDRIDRRENPERLAISRHFGFPRLFFMADSLEHFRQLALRYDDTTESNLNELIAVTSVGDPDILILDAIYSCKSLLKLNELLGEPGYKAYQVPYFGSAWGRKVGVLSKVDLINQPTVENQSSEPSSACGASFQLNMVIGNRSLVIVGALLASHPDPYGAICRMSVMEIDRLQTQLNVAVQTEDTELVFIGDFGETGYAREGQSISHYRRSVVEVFAQQNSLVLLKESDGRGRRLLIGSSENVRFAVDLIPILVTERLTSRLQVLARSVQHIRVFKSTDIIADPAHPEMIYLQLDTRDFGPLLEQHFELPSLLLSLLFIGVFVISRTFLE